MKIETTKERLEEALGRVGRAATRQSTLPVLSCIFFEAGAGTLSLRATNLDLGVETMIPVKAKDGGVFAIPGVLAQSVVAGLPPESLVTLELRDGNLLIFSGARSSLVKAIPHEDFPVLPHVARESGVRVAVDDLVSGLRSVWYSASLSTIKPELSSVSISVIDGMLVFAATDAFRLAEKRVRPKTGPLPASFGQLLVPCKNAGEIMRILEGLSGEVELVSTGSQLGVYHDGVYVTSRLVEGMFPDYRQIIPKEHVTEAIILKRDLINALKYMTLFSDKFNQVRVTVQPSGKRLHIATKSAEVGESSEELPAALSGEDLEIAFNHRYLADCFQSISDESIRLQFAGLGKPLVVRGVSDDSFLYLVMPMNT